MSAPHNETNINTDNNFAIVAKPAQIYTEWSGSSGNITGVEVSITSIQNTMTAIGQDYQNVGAVTLDGVFCPYTTESGHDTLPYWGIAQDTTDIFNQSLNPFFPDNMLAKTGVKTIEEIYYESGTNIAGFNSFSGVGKNAEGDLSPYADMSDNGKISVLARGVGLKAPLVLSGWGRDIDGNPVPSDSGDPTKFAQNAFRDPSIWKSGPLNVRWDYNTGMWTGGNTTKIYLVKVTNLYNPPNFSYEVDRSNSRSQYSRLAPETKKTFSATENIYDPEAVAYNANPNNVGTYESLDYTNVEFPHYEAFIIRETIDDVGNDYYNIWTEDCQDCGHISNSGCGTQNGMESAGKKILIENPLRQSLDVGDLAFTVKTGRKKNVNTGIFTGGSGVLGSGNIVTDSSGNGSFQVTSAGSGYSLGAFGIVDSGICVSVSLFTEGGVITSGTISPSSNLPHDQTYSVSIYPTNATVETESLDIHWITQAEFKHQQVITHVEADGGLLQTCSVKLQTQGFKTCEWCGEDTSLINSF